MSSWICELFGMGSSGNFHPCGILSVTLWMLLAHQVSQFLCDRGQQEVMNSRGPINNGCYTCGKGEIFYLMMFIAYIM
jgi:hypothetical protein